jgi:hypothetical protein
MKRENVDGCLRRERNQEAEDEAGLGENEEGAQSRAVAKKSNELAEARGNVTT